MYLIFYRCKNNTQANDTGNDNLEVREGAVAKRKLSNSPHFLRKAGSEETFSRILGEIVSKSS